MKLLAQNTLNLGPITGTGTFMQGGATQYTLLGNFISTVINVITVIAGLAFVLYFALGGLKWLMASGDKGKVEEAKTELTNAALGLVVVVVSYFIAGIIGGVLGLNLLNPLKLLGL